MSNIKINKTQLSEYLLDFYPDRVDDILFKFESIDFDIGASSFKGKMKRIIGMPKIGKRTLIYWLSRGWSKEEAHERRVPDNRDPETSPMNINFWRKRGYSVKDAEYKIKSQRKLNKEYWLVRGYSMEDAVNETTKFQKKSNKVFIDKLKSDELFAQGVFSKRKNNINYWIDRGHTIDESIKLQSSAQRTFSIDICIDKYGEKLGRERWECRQKKWGESLLNNGNLMVGWSNVSQILFDKILCEVDDNRKDFIFYGTKNKEYPLVGGGGVSFLYDFTDVLCRRIIEFNGDIYHGNPDIFGPNDKPNPFKDISSSDLWERDRIKIELAEQNGFSVLTIWESEYKKDKQGSIDRCLEFLKK